MQKLESIKLFKDLQNISTKYINLELRNNTTEVEAYNKMQELLLVHKSQLQQIKEKSNSISMQIREEIKSNNCNNIYNNIIQLNNLFKDKCNYIKNSDMEFENTCVKITLLSTVDELSLVNESVRNKDFLNDRLDTIEVDIDDIGGKEYSRTRIYSLKIENKEQWLPITATEKLLSYRLLNLGIEPIDPID